MNLFTADSMAGLPSGSGTPSSLSSLHPAAQALNSREQELLQRELYNRACMDPALAHQVCYTAGGKKKKKVLS